MCGFQDYLSAFPVRLEIQEGSLVLLKYYLLPFETHVLRDHVLFSQAGRYVRTDGWLCAFELQAQNAHRRYLCPC